MDAPKCTNPDQAKAYFDSRGDRYPAFLADWIKTGKDVQSVVDDLGDVMEWLRETDNLPQADRVRTLIGRLARSVPPYPVFGAWDDPKLYRNLARTYPNQLTPKESKAIEKRMAEKDSERERMIAEHARLMAEKNARIAELEKALREIESGECVRCWSDNPHEDMQSIARNTL